MRDRPRRARTDCVDCLATAVGVESPREVPLPRGAPARTSSRAAAVPRTRASSAAGRRNHSAPPRPSPPLGASARRPCTRPSGFATRQRRTRVGHVLSPDDATCLSYDPASIASIAAELPVMAKSRGQHRGQHRACFQGISDTPDSRNDARLRCTPGVPKRPAGVEPATSRSRSPLCCYRVPPTRR